VAVQDAEKYLEFCRSNYETKIRNLSMWEVTMQSRRQIDCFREIAGQIERFGLSILHPPKQLSLDEEDMFLGMVFMMYKHSCDSEIEEHLKCVICRDKLFINVLAAHLQYCDTYEDCDVTNVLMARFVSRYVDSNSAVHLLNSGFLVQLVLLLRSNQQHVLLYALKALVPLFVVKKKILNKILKILVSAEVGLGLAISNILCQYSMNGLREMELCDCNMSLGTSDDCATQCITSVYQVICFHGIMVFPFSHGGHRFPMDIFFGSLRFHLPRFPFKFIISSSSLPSSSLRFSCYIMLGCYVS